MSTYMFVSTGSDVIFSESPGIPLKTNKQFICSQENKNFQPIGNIMALATLIINLFSNRKFAAKTETTSRSNRSLW